MVRIGMAAALVLAAGAASAQDLVLTGLAGQSVTLTPADMAALPHETRTVTIEGKTSTYQGVPLSTLLARVGAPAGKAVKGPELDDVIVVGAKDGYSAVLALAEVDPLFRPEHILLADKADGAPLPDGLGPYRLVVEGDLRAARAVRAVTSITLRRVGP